MTGTKKIINFTITTGEYSLFVDELINLGKARISSITCVANVHMFIEAQRDPDFLDIINNSTFITPDGQPLTWALRLLYGVKQSRVAGMDLLPDLLAEMERQNMLVFFYGGTQTMLDQTKKYIQETYPSLQIAGLYSPPFRNLTDEEQAQTAEMINNARPNIVFVILGCPKQEKWMASMKGKVQSVMIGVGGALPVMIGMQKRAPLWMQKSGLEWLYRLIQEPGRLFKRYALTNSYFILVVVKELIRIKILKPFTTRRK